MTGWDVLGVLHTENPKHSITPCDVEMVRLWRLFSPGMGGGFLPDAGAVMDQAAIMLDAFAVMSAAETAFKRKHGNQDRV